MKTYHETLRCFFSFKYKVDKMEDKIKNSEYLIEKVEAVTKSEQTRTTFAQ